MVSVLLASYRPRDSPISLIAFMQGAIVAGSIIECIFSDWNFNRKLVVMFMYWFIHYSGRNSIFVYPCHPFMAHFLSMIMLIHFVSRSKTECKSLLMPFSLQEPTGKEPGNLKFTRKNALYAN